jgi:hypothetical protein
MTQDQVLSIGVESIKRFIEVCQECGYSGATIMEQIRLVCEGVRDGRLCDNCIVLLDGMK